MERSSSRDHSTTPSASTSTSGSTAPTPRIRRPPTTSTSASNPTATPRRPPLPGAPSTLLTTSPHYTTSLRSRHSLYGTEDRIILDLGSKIWKCGFSGETGPRECVDMGREGIWELEKGEREEKEWLAKEEKVKRALRNIYFNHLMSDPKARKVILLEPPLMPLRIKELLAQVLFENLQVPSINFASSSLLALMAVGKVDGLVVDVGHLETTILPISSSRPLFSHLLTTPLAGSQFTLHLQSLLLKYAEYIPPPSNLNNISTGKSKRGKVPKDVLNTILVEEIKDRVCFVAERLSEEDETDLEDVMEVVEEEDDLPPGITPSLIKRYQKKATATSLVIPIPSLDLPTVASGVGRGYLVVPGWVREYASEIFWERGDADRWSLAEGLLEVLRKLPIDLRKPMAENVLVVGGTTMMPGFLPRLRTELLSTISSSKPFTPPPSPSPPATPQALRRQTLFNRLSLIRSSSPYSSLIPLLNHIAILNDPSTTSAIPDIVLHPNNGSAPNFKSSLLSWIGGSLAGALKIGGEEILREDWEKEDVEAEVGLGMEGMEQEAEGEKEERGGKKALVRDWSRERFVRNL